VRKLIGDDGVQGVGLQLTVRERERGVAERAPSRMTSARTTPWCGSRGTIDSMCRRGSW
jgi:hypothetical protein